LRVCQKEVKGYKINIYLKNAIALILLNKPVIKSNFFIQFSSAPNFLEDLKNILQDLKIFCMKNKFFALLKDYFLAALLIIFTNISSVLSFMASMHK
jgi:hypothetical protein